MKQIISGMLLFVIFLIFITAIGFDWPTSGQDSIVTFFLVPGVAVCCLLTTAKS